jgi:replicative DNA helicase
MTANYLAAANLFASWRDDVLSGSPPILFAAGTGELERIEIGPRRVLLLGGAPGAGKSAFTMQCVIDALRMTPTLRALVCSVEMTPAVLMDRQLARLSGVDLDTIRFRRLGVEHGERIDLAMQTLEPLAERLAFVKAPFNLDNVAASADAFGDIGLIVLDYIQRIPPPGNHGDKRGAVDATMDYLRQFADAGLAVIVVAAVARSKDAKGRSTYHGDALSLASFRESSELEFGADDAFILVADPDDDSGVILRHLKARHTEAKDMALTFDRPRQRFTPRTSTPTPTAGKLQSALADLWNTTAPADEETGGAK